jgi:hypothetical protein
MANIKKLIALSEWLTYEFDPGYMDPRLILDPPIFKVRVRPINAMVLSDIEPKELKQSSMTFEMVVDAVQEWDLTDEGTPIPCTEENKRLHLPILINQKIKEKNTFLWIELMNYAGDLGNFIRP